MRGNIMIQRSLLGLALAMSVPHPAAADTPEERSEARAHYELAKKLVLQRDFARAAEEFRKAYEILPRFEVLYNLGQAYVALDRKPEAVDALSRYLVEGGQQVPAARRSEVDQELERLRRELPEEAPRAVEAGSAPEPPAPPPVAIVPLPERPRAEPRRPMLATSAPVAWTPDESTSNRTETPMLRVAGFAGASVGLLLGAGAVIVYADNAGRYSRWERRQATLNQDWDEALGTPAASSVSSAQNENNELGRSIMARDRTAAILGIAGGALVAGGVTVVLFTYFPARNRQADVAVQAGVGSFRLSGRF